jgi:hypothetical protein
VSSAVHEHTLSAASINGDIQGKGVVIATLKDQPPLAEAQIDYLYLSTLRIWEQPLVFCFPGPPPRQETIPTTIRWERDLSRFGKNEWP